jgi:Uma2 family endonuclease
MSTSTRITVAEYDEMIDRGYFDPTVKHRVELIEGSIVAMSPIGHLHCDALERITRWSHLDAPIEQFLVRVKGSLGIPELDSVPEPDMAWVGYRIYKARPQAADVLLLVEVADSSLAFDRGDKARIYASAGIADYWVVNVPGRCVEVHREPRDGAYRSVRTYSPGESIPPLAFPEVALPVELLFPIETQ